MDKSNNLNNLRNKIDKVDQELLELLEKRAALALQTKIYKAKSKIKSVFDPSRELNILNKISENNNYLLPSQDRRVIFKDIINACRNIQFESNKESLNNSDFIISVQGDIGSHSENAALTYIKNNGLDLANRSYDMLYAISSKQVLDQLCNGESMLGVLAISNSTAGVVAETLSALSILAENLNLVKKVHVLDYLSIPVRHSLLCKNNQDINKITDIYSHSQALAQCREFLNNNYASINLHEYSDTAEAARDLSQNKLPAGSAVIAHSNCIDNYNLKNIKSNIQDNPNNETSFIVLKAIT